MSVAWLTTLTLLLWNRFGDDEISIVKRTDFHEIKAKSLWLNFEYLVLYFDICTLIYNVMYAIL